MSTEENKAIVQLAMKNFGNPEQRTHYFELYDPNCILHGYAGVEPGIENIKQSTHQGDFMGIPATGKKIALTGCTILRFANGKCIEWSQADFLGMLQQLGAVPAMGQ